MATFLGLRQVPGYEYYIVQIASTDYDTVKNERPSLILEGELYTPIPSVGDYYYPPRNIFTGRPVKPHELWYEKVTDTERGSIFALSQADGGGFSLNMVQRGRLQAYLAFSMANVIPIDDPETIFIFDALETAGVLAAGRADEILER